MHSVSCREWIKACFQNRLRVFEIVPGDVRVGVALNSHPPGVKKFPVNKGLDLPCWFPVPAVVSSSNEFDFFFLIGPGRMLLFHKPEKTAEIIGHDSDV